MVNKLVEIEYSVLKDNEIQELVEFYNSIHNSVRDVEKFRWEFFDSSFGPSIYVIARDKLTNKIVGSQAAIPIEFVNSEGEILLTAKSEDTIVDPNYRGLSIFDKMYELLISECKKCKIEYIWGFTSAIKPFKKLGFDFPFVHSQSLLVINLFNSYKYLSSLNLSNSILRKLKIFILTLVSRVKGLLISSLYSYKKGYDLEISNTIKDIPDELILQISKYENIWISINRTKGFLQWRITENPYSLGIFYVTIKKESEIYGLFAFSSNTNGVWFLVEEFYKENLSLNERSFLFLKASKLLSKNKAFRVDIIRTWDFNHNQNSRNLINSKKNAGFIHLNTGIPFVWLNISNKKNIDVMDLVLSRSASQGML